MPFTGGEPQRNNWRTVLPEPEGVCSRSLHRPGRERTPSCIRPARFPWSPCRGTIPSPEPLLSIKQQVDSLSSHLWAPSGQCGSSPSRRLGVFWGEGMDKSHYHGHLSLGTYCVPGAGQSLWAALHSVLRASLSGRHLFFSYCGLVEVRLRPASFPAATW